MDKGIAIISSIIRKMENIDANNKRLNQIRASYRMLFNTDSKSYHDNDDDILAKECGIKGLEDAFTKNNWCWVDFFGCDSFSESKEKRQIFFATLCQNEKDSKERKQHVNAYIKKIEKGIPMDAFIQLFFPSSSIEDNFKTGDLEKLSSVRSSVLTNGFYIDLSSLDKNKRKLKKAYNCNIQENPRLISLFESTLNNVELGNLGMQMLNCSKLTEETTEQRLLRGICSLNRALHKDVKFVFFIPIPCPDGSVALTCIGKKDKMGKDEMSLIKLMSFTILYPFVSAYKSAWHQEKVKRESAKAAKAAIMSRNMSHNLGSHVMFYIKQRLESVNTIFKTNSLRELIRANSLQDLKYKLENSQIKFGDEMPFLVGLGSFFNYLQERQDYIATIATNHIPYRTTVNFKDAIYDELKPEKRYERHKNDKDAKDRKSENLILDFIAYSEGFKTSDAIELLFGEKFDGGKCPEDVPDELREFDIALPGGNLGRQALFSIMENIIRNTAKHESGHTKKDKLSFRFDKLKTADIKDIHSYSWRMGEDENNIKNNINTSNNNCYKRCDDDLYYLGITVILENTETEIDNTLNKIRIGLWQNYLTDGQMDENCKGLKEIRISAAWIRGKEMDDEISDKEPPAVAIRKTNENNLQYIICIPKPKKVAYIKSKNKTSNINFNAKNDCIVYEENEICDSIVKKISNYEIVVVDRTVNSKTYELLRRNVGARIFKIKKPLNEHDSEETVYEMWLKSAFKIKDFPWISILDGDINSSVYSKVGGIKVQESGTGDKSYKLYDKCIVYSRHYSGQPYYEKNDCRNYSSSYFVESISGGNTTFRLVKNDKKNFVWYSKQVASGLTKVAVFDERLYGIVMPEGDYEKDIIKRIILKFFQNYRNYNKKIHSNTVWQIFCQEILKDHLKVDEKLVRKDIYKKLASSNLQINTIAENSVEIVLALLSEFISIKSYEKTWKYRETGVWAFNIKVEPENQKVIIVGYNAPVSKTVGQYNIKFKEKELIIIKRNEGNIEVKDTLYLPRQYKFDFITIHQGILDRICTALKIDKSDTGREERMFVTSELHRILSKKKPCDSFLPQFIIHSGRSKPNMEDMPQKQPFLQFSALEHALRDCKYTLVELLNSAHYE